VSFGDLATTIYVAVICDHPLYRYEEFARRLGGAVLDHFIDALENPKQHGRSVLVVVVAYIAVWTLYGLIAKSNQDLHPDMTELIAWSRDLALGFPKHPPFAAVIVRGWFALLPISDGTFYLLAMVMATISLWIAWLLFEDYLDPTKRLVGVVLLTFIPFFNFHALKFNVNTALMPTWAVTTLWFLRSYRTSSPVYAALAGVGAAVCMMTKYWSIFLVVGLAVAALSGARRSAYFKSSAPLITTLVAIAAFSPHLGWLEKHGFPTIFYALREHGHRSFADATAAALRYILDTAAFGSVPFGIVVLATRPKLVTIKEMVWPTDPDRRVAAVTFWATMLIPVIAASFGGIELDGIWSMSAWTLFPVLLLGPRQMKLSPLVRRRIVGVAVLIPLVLLLLSPAVALLINSEGLSPKQTQMKQLSSLVEQSWHAASPTPLRLVGGDTDLADGVAAYAMDRPLVALPRLHLPVKRDGIAFVCLLNDAKCTKSLQLAAKADPRSRVIEQELVHYFLGSAGPSERYLVAIIPPISGTE